MQDFNFIDKWGGIDKNIKCLVIALNEKGFTTSGSCNGHVNYGSPAPWVMVRIFSEHEPEETENLKNKMISFLGDFYKNRNTLEDLKISILAGHDGFWLYNGGKKFLVWRKETNEIIAELANGNNIETELTEEEKVYRQKHLTDFQAEMNAFAHFLTSQ